MKKTIFVIHALLKLFVSHPKSWFPAGSVEPVGKQARTCLQRHVTAPRVFIAIDSTFDSLLQTWLRYRLRETIRSDITNRDTSVILSLAVMLKHQHPTLENTCVSYRSHPRNNSWLSCNIEFVLSRMPNLSHRTFSPRQKEVFLNHNFDGRSINNEFVFIFKTSKDTRN